MLFEYKLDSSLPLMRSSSPSAAAWNEGGHSKIKWPHFFGNIGSNIPSYTFLLKSLGFTLVCEIRVCV